MRVRAVTTIGVGRVADVVVALQDRVALGVDSETVRVRDLDIDTEWRLSSDMDGMEQGASLHADYFAAWTDDPPGS